MSEPTGFLADLEASYTEQDDAPEWTDESTPSGPTVNPEFVDPPKRPRKATQYEDKVGESLRAATLSLIANPYTVADAAALLATGPAIAEAWGDLAAVDPRVARGIDWLDQGVSNPYLAAAVATAPLILQVFRNHVPDLEPIAEVPIPGTKRRMKLRYRIRIDRLDKVTQDPGELVAATFTPEVREHIKNENRVSVAQFRRKLSRQERRAQRESS